MQSQKHSFIDHLKFIIPSILGIFLFMIPVPTSDGLTIPIGLLSDWVQGLLDDYLSAIMMVIIVITAIMTLIASLSKPHAFDRTPFFKQLFRVTPFWVVTRVLAAIFAIMVFFHIGPEAFYSEETGQQILDDLLHVLFAVFLFAGLFLPLLMNFGLLDFFGTLMTKIMRPLFRLPGRASIDSLASWVGDGTIGVLLTSKQYEDGYYTKREAAVIGTTFSVVSITFTLAVIKEVNLQSMFVPFYLTVILAGFVAALIMPRIPPLSRKADTYIDNGKGNADETIPTGHNSLTFGYQKALDQAKRESSLYKFFKEGAQNILDMWMGVAPVVMSFGLIALMIAEYTPLFQWLGVPFIPFLELLHVPAAADASETILIGFADMFLPSVVGSSIDADMTRFIVAALSVTQLIYLSEVGGLLLGSKVPVSFLDLLIIYLLRTLITLPIIALVAHLLF